MVAVYCVGYLIGGVLTGGVVAAMFDPKADPKAKHNWVTFTFFCWPIMILVITLGGSVLLATQIMYSIGDCIRELAIRKPPADDLGRP